MRRKIEPRVELNFHRSNLKLTTEYYAKYEAISTILDEQPEILDRFHEDLKDSLGKAASGGGKGKGFIYTTDTLVRILLCQVIEGLSLREVVVRIDDGRYLRRFVRLENRPMMDYTTLCRLKNAIAPETWKAANRLLGKAAVAKELISGERLRLDTTAVETNIHWPSDSAQLWDVYRVLSQLIERARELDSEAVGKKRLHRSRAKRLRTKISRKASKKGKGTAALKPFYEELLGMVEELCEWSGSVAERLRAGVAEQGYGVVEDAIARAVAEAIDDTVALGGQVIDQTRRRVLGGEQVPNDEKLFSIFEPHTELLKRGKAGKDLEFGHMIQIQQVAEKFITDYDVFRKRPVDYELLSPALESHRELFGHDPQQLAADKGYYETMAVIQDLETRIECVAIGKKGKRTPEETEREHDPVFRHAQRFRAGIEGTISFLKRVLGLVRCFNKGWQHFEATVGAAIFSHNLLVLARC